MNIYITNIYNLNSAGETSQHKIRDIAKQMRISELAHSRYDTDIDNDIELEKRIETILVPIREGDIVIMQVPSCNSLRYDYMFVKKIKSLQKVKLIILVHDFIPFMLNWRTESLQKMIEIFNFGDMIIAASQRLLDELNKCGLNVEKQLCQKIWDYPIEFESEKPSFQKRIYFTGNPSRFPFLKEWKGMTEIMLYSNESFSTENLNIVVRKYQKEHKLLLDLSEGGYGLVWASDEANDYYKMLQPYKVASYLAAGIPVIVQKGLAPEEILLKNRLGFAVETLEEADAIVQSTTETEYNEMINRISGFNVLIKNGWYTRKLLTDAIMWLLNENYKPR